MKNATALASIIILGTLCGPSRAQQVPLNCKDYVLLTETAVQQRDAKFSRKESLKYLGGDEFMNKRDELIVRRMIERVFQKAKEGLAYHLKQSKSECSIFPAAR